MRVGSNADVAHIAPSLVQDPGDLTGMDRYLGLPMRL